MPQLEFWYEFASNYSYLSAMRIDELARAANVEVEWRPFLLGPIFKAQGWHTSPFNLFPAKGRHMVRDMERIAAARGLDFVMPKPFPANGLPAARVAYLGQTDEWVGPFTAAVFEAEFGRGADISDVAVLEKILTKIGVDSRGVLARSREQNVKDGLREQTGRAQEIGIFGAPTFITEDAQLFWGDDRLEQALDWARKSLAPELPD
jgi:2-hydroxychromene-2-carboxylate isomerase